VADPKTIRILVDFEDAFTTSTGIPTALVNDAICLILSGFDLILWYSDKAKTPQIHSWMDKYLNEEQQSRIQLLNTRPRNLKMWMAQFAPWIFKQNVICDFSYASLFPRLPIEGNQRPLLRIYDPFGAHNSPLKTLFNTLFSGATIKNALARAIRTYGYIKLNKQDLVKIYISESTKKLCQLIYQDSNPNDLVIYPTVQFAVQELATKSTKSIKPNNLKPYFIFIGGQRQRKNPLSIVNLWAESLHLYKFNLVVVGSIEANKLSPAVVKAINIGRFKMVKNISVEELRSQIENSEGIVYNTLPDGFGYPIAEGIYLQKPVICNDLEVFREIGGSYPYFFAIENYAQALQILTDINDGNISMTKESSKKFDLWNSVKNWQASLSSFKVI
jgi:hypothetical protein